MKKKEKKKNPQKDTKQPKHSEKVHLSSGEACKDTCQSTQPRP